MMPQSRARIATTAGTLKRATERSEYVAQAKILKRMSRVRGTDGSKVDRRDGG